MREPVDTCVQGNDCWPADDDPATDNFRLVFDVLSYGTQTDRPIRCFYREPGAERRPSSVASA